MSVSAFLFATLVRATPLLLVGLAVALAFRARVLNIGAEGQLLAGATAAVAVGLACAGLPGPLLVTAELAAGIVAGALWAGIAAVLRERFGVLEVISTLMLNFVAQYGVSYLVRGPLQEPSRVYPQSVSLSEAARLPALFTGQQVHAGLPIAVLLALVLAWGLRATAVGFRVRVVGAGAAAAACAGRVRVARIAFGVFLASGALAGLGGAAEATGNTFALYEGISPGFGYSAIAVALLARLEPAAVIGSSLFFGALEVGAAALKRDAGVPSELAGVIEALIVLGLLATQRWRDVAVSRRSAVRNATPA